MGGPINLKKQKHPIAALSRYRGAIFGLACGDALGYPVEFSSAQEIRSRYGPEGITDLPTPALFTDDTQMSCALAEGLLARPHGDSDQIAVDIAAEFTAWSVSPENNRAPGTTCMAGCRNLRDGVNWRESGVPGSRGCGAVMRVAPIGLAYRDYHVLRQVAGNSATMTHNSPVGRESAHLGALAVRLLLDGTKPQDLLDELRGSVVVFDSSLNVVLDRIEPAIDVTLRGDYKPHEIMVPVSQHACALGLSWHADECIASALYCFLLAEARGEGYVEAVCYGANTDGDSDSIACVAGGLAGTYWGMGGAHGVPYAWGHRIENAVSLTGLAARLHKLSQEVNSG